MPRNVNMNLNVTSLTFTSRTKLRWSFQSSEMLTSHSFGFSSDAEEVSLALAAIQGHFAAPLLRHLCKGDHNVSSKIVKYFPLLTNQRLYKSQFSSYPDLAA